MSSLNFLGHLANYGGMFGSAAINQRQQDKQNAFQYYLWERQNQYNSPSAQLARLIAAGAAPNSAMSAVLGHSVGQSTANDMPSAASYSPVSPPSLSDSMALQQSFDAHTLSTAEAQLKRAEAMQISQSISHESDYHPYKLSSMMADASRRFFDNNIAFETYGDQLFKIRSDASASYYNALNAAFDAWEKGYLPEGITREQYKQWYTDNGQVIVNNNNRRFANEFYNQINGANNAILQAQDDYELSHYDVSYMRELFGDMVAFDREKFEHDLSMMRSHSKVFSAMSEHDWLQFVDYFIDKLGGFAQSAGSAYSNFSRSARAKGTK